MSDDDLRKADRERAFAAHRRRMDALYRERDNNALRSYSQCKGLLDFFVRNLKAETIEYEIARLEPNEPWQIEEARKRVAEWQRRLDKYSAAPWWKREFLNYD